MAEFEKSGAKRTQLNAENDSNLSNFTVNCNDGHQESTHLNAKDGAILNRFSKKKVKSSAETPKIRHKWLSLSDPFAALEDSNSEGCACSSEGTALRIKTETSSETETGAGAGSRCLKRSDRHLHTHTADAEPSAIPEVGAPAVQPIKKANPKLKQAITKHKQNLAQKRKHKSKPKIPPKPFNWKELQPDKTGLKPTISFDPKSKERPRQIEVLQKRAVDRERQKLVAKIKSEFMRIYSRYRFSKDRWYKMHPQEERFVAQAGVLCIMKGITPTDLIDYWDHHMSDFTDMDYPTMAFLASPQNVDKAVASLSAFKDGHFNSNAFQRGTTKESMEHLGTSRSTLDPRLRRGLMEAGLDVQRYDDRSLLTIQFAAETISRGIDMFISSKMKPLVDWAVANLFSKAEAQ